MILNETIELIVETPWLVPAILINIHLRFRMKIYPGEETSREILFQLNVIPSLISFFKCRFPFSAYLATFSEQLYFQRSYFFIPLQINYFVTTVTFS